MSNAKEKYLCKEDWAKPACPDCGAVDCDRASSSNYKCSSRYKQGQGKVCPCCGRMECPSLLIKISDLDKAIQVFRDYYAFLQDEHRKASNQGFVFRDARDKESIEVCNAKAQMAFKAGCKLVELVCERFDIDITYGTQTLCD